MAKKIIGYGFTFINRDQGVKVSKVFDGEEITADRLLVFLQDLEIFMGPLTDVVLDDVTDLREGQALAERLEKLINEHEKDHISCDCHFFEESDGDDPEVEFDE